jgi:hypothetical protein
MIYGNAPGNATPATDPKVDRVKADAGTNGCDAAALAAPCFDDGKSGTGTVDGGPYKSSFSTATWTGNTVTISGGLAAHARPFVRGQAFFCSSCNSGLVIDSLSVPPTQSTATGAGEVGQTFTFVVKNASGQAIGGSGSGAVTAGCWGTSGTGSNCIDIAIATNVSGTFGTAAAIDTCGANNINGNAPNYVVPNGKCQGNGIGEIVRAFRIGTNQFMYLTSAAQPPTTGSFFDDGVDIANGSFTQSSSFTCNIVAAKVVQCVKGPGYAEGAPVSVGLWPSTAVNWASASVASATYNSATGNLALTFSTAPFGASVGSILNGAQVTVSGLTGTGSVASLNGTWVITSTGSSGTVINLGAPAALTVTITSTTGSIAASTGTFISYGDLTVVSGRLASLLGFVGGQSFPFTPGSGYTNGTTTQTAVCPTVASGDILPRFDVTVAGGAIVNVVPSAATTGSPAGLGIGSACTVPLPAGGTGGAIATIPVAPFEGQGGIGTYNTDSNTMGMFLYDNSGEPGNPLNQFFTNSQGGYFEPGLPVRPFGLFQGAAVSG